MSSIAFPNGSTMQIEKVYEVKAANPRATIDKAIANPKDNADYVLFNKGDKLFVAVGKGDLRGHDKNVTLGVDKAVKFNLDGEELTAVKVVDRTNTGEAFRDAKAWEYFNPGMSIGAPALFGLAGGMISQSPTGLVVGAVVGLGGVIGSYFADKHMSTSIKHPDLEYLINQKSLIEAK